MAEQKIVLSTAEEENSRSLASIKASLDKDYGQSGDLLKAAYDPDAFDSMAVMNSEIWNLGADEEGGVSPKDLLPNGPSSLSLEKRKETFLTAAENGVLEVIKDLHRFHGNSIIAIRDEDEYTPLHRASYNGHSPVVEYLLSEGADVLAKTVDGWQPLHCACRWNKVKVASILLQNGACVNSQTNGGQSPLHLASSNDRAKDTLELLLTQPDIDVELRNGQGEVAKTVAERNGRFVYLFEIVEPSIDYRQFLKEK